MIRHFRHRGLRLLYERGDGRRLPPEQREKIRRVLARLDAATAPGDMDLPGYRLHRLQGDLSDFWSVSISANWRVIFRFEEGDAVDLDYLDYH